MRKVLGLPFVLFILAASILGSCTKSSPVGSELLAGDQANIEFTDTLTLRMRTISEDSIIVQDPFRTGNAFTFHLLGDFADPIFGKANASIYGQMKALSAIIIDSLDFTTASLDSIVLSLVYDPNGFYGVEDETYDISVYRLNEDMDPFETYYSNQDFEFDATPIATHTFIPAPTDSILLEGDENKSAPQLRIPLSTDLGNEFLAQPYPFESLTQDSAFLAFFKGLYIKANTETNGIISFNLASGASGISLYFTTDEGANRYTYSFNSNSLSKISRMEHTFSSTVNDALAGGLTAGENELYLQALSGPNIEIEIPFAGELTNSIINKAELEFTINVQDTSDFPNPTQIILATRNSDGGLSIIDDVDFALNKGNISLFGGQVEEASTGDLRLVYKMNIAGAFQEITDGLEEKTLVLRILPKQEQASRVILYGPGHPQYPAKLNLTYTRLNE